MIAIVNESRLVGCELEMFGLVDSTTLKSLLIANGIDCGTGSYSSNVSRNFQVVVKPDGSIRPEGDYSYHAYELIWRMSMDNAGVEFVRKLCYILNTLGMKVNSSCGFHVHVDGHDSTLEQMKSLYNLCYKYENIIAGFIPPASRGRNYAKLRGAGDRELLARARSVGDVMNRCHDRQFGLNLASWSKNERKTIEFRYHSPTVDSDKVLNWCMLCLRLYEHAKARRCTSKTKLPNNPANLRNFLCAVGLKPNNRIYTTIDVRLNLVRDYLVKRWWKFERATREHIRTRRARTSQSVTYRSCNNCGYMENGLCTNSVLCTGLSQWLARDGVTI